MTSRIWTTKDQLAETAEVSFKDGLATGNGEYMPYGRNSYLQIQKGHTLFTVNLKQNS